MLGMRTFMIGTKQPMKNFPDNYLHPQLDKDHTEAVVLFLAEAQKLATRALRSSLRWPILYFFFLSRHSFSFWGSTLFSYFFLDPFFPLILFRLSFESWILLHRSLLSPNLPPLRIP